MPSESTTGIGRASEISFPLRPVLLALLPLLGGLLIILAIPLSANALQPRMPDLKASARQLPVAPAGVGAGLPYETRPPQQQQSPQRHGGPDAFGYVYDDEGEPGAGVTYNWVDGANRIAD